MSSVFVEDEESGRRGSYTAAPLEEDTGKGKSGGAGGGRFSLASMSSSGSSPVAMVGACCCSTVAVIIAIFIQTAIPIAQIVMGVIHKDHCPREDYLSIYHIVSGSFGLFKCLIDVIVNIKNKAAGDSDNSKNQHPLSSLIGLFLFAWFIAGCVWIYSMYDDFQSDFPRQDDYCHATFYWFSFWLNTSVFIILGLCLVVAILACIVMCIVKCVS